MPYIKILTIHSKEGIERVTDYVSDKRKTCVENSMEAAGDTAGASEFGIETGSAPYDLKDTITAVTRYTSNPLKTMERKLVTGINCPAGNAASEMRSLTSYWKSRRHYHGTSRDAFHIIQSFDPKDNPGLTPETAHEIGKKFAVSLQHMDDKNEVDRKYKMLLTTHVDKKHIHNHIVLCSYDILTGRKFHECRDVYRQMKASSDRLCLEYGLSVIEDPDLERRHSRKEYEESKTGSSWKDKVRRDIEAVSENVSDWSSFVAEMYSAGYRIRQARYITYTDPDGHKVRDKTLGREWTRASLEEKWLDKQLILLPKITSPKDRVKEYYLLERDQEAKDSYDLDHIGLYDEYGRKRTALEMLLLVAIEMLLEGDAWNIDGIYYRQYHYEHDPEEERARRIRVLEETVDLAREEGIASEDQLKKRLDQTGAELSHVKLELKKNRATKNKMDVIKETVDKYEAVLPQVESILKTEDRTQREKLQKQYAGQIQIWKESKAFLYRFQCTSPAEREDFHSRYEVVKENIATLNKRSRELGEQYKRLIRIRDGVVFARNPDSIPGKSFDERQTGGHSQPDPSAHSEQEQSTI